MRWEDSWLHTGLICQLALVSSCFQALLSVSSFLRQNLQGTDMSEQNEQEIGTYFDECARNGLMETFDSSEMMKLRNILEQWDIKPGHYILEPGCGSGRFMEIAEKYAAEVVGIDMSFSVDSAFKNLGFKENTHVIQADILSLPLKENCFDYIFSIGVLHHTTNTREAFRQLPKLLKRGGEIAIWVYSDEGFLKKIYNRISSFYRLFTTRIPNRFLYRLSYISIPLYYPKKVRILRTGLNLILPTSVHPNPKWRVLDTFDWYSPKYQWKHSYKEVVGWFEEEGLTNIISLDIPVSVKGKRQ